MATGFCKYIYITVVTIISHDSVVSLCTSQSICIQTHLYKIFTDVWCAFVMIFSGIFVQNAQWHIVCCSGESCLYWGSAVVCDWTKRRTQIRTKLLWVPACSAIFQFKDYTVTKLSVTTTSIIKFITCDLFSNVFWLWLKIPIYSC